MRDGVQGVTSGAIYFQFQMGNEYNSEISKGMNYWRWLQIKRVKKLCNYNTASKRIVWLQSEIKI